MFELEILDQFYEWKEDDENFDVSDEVKQAYYIFIKDICTLVSSFFNHYLKSLEDRNSATFVNNLTRSDEAFTYWLIKCQYNRCKDEAAILEQKGVQAWEQERKKGKSGKHDSIARFDDYCDIFFKVKDIRENPKAYGFWQDIFFDVMFESQSKDKEKKTVSTKRQSRTEVPISNEAEFY
jgi:succinate dehydrogenase flavin-adding protein (antitoxin of CptAB toxin-antitoxin module)